MVNLNFVSSPSVFSFKLHVDPALSRLRDDQRVEVRLLLDLFEVLLNRPGFFGVDGGVEVFLGLYLAVPLLGLFRFNLLFGGYFLINLNKLFYFFAAPGTRPFLDGDWFRLLRRKNMPGLFNAADEAELLVIEAHLLFGHVVHQMLVRSLAVSAVVLTNALN